MTFHWPNPSLSTIFKPSRVVLLGLWLALLPGVPQASPVTFDAHYEFYRDNSHVADTRLSLHQKEHQWIWTMQTEPRGFYRWLTSKKPFEEVRMIGSADALQLQQMYKGDHPEQPAEQTTFFDNASGVIYHSDGKRNQQLQLDFQGPVFSYLSIHLLYADMKRHASNSKTVDFFKDGELLKATLTLQPAVKVVHDGVSHIADRVTHRIEGSAKSLVYYYAGHDLAPLKIEQIKQGKIANSMWRSRLN